MNTFSLLILLLIATSIVALVSSSSLLGSTVNTAEQEQEQQGEQQDHRRQLIQGTTCKLFLRHTEYGPTEDKPNGHSEEAWVCELPQEESSRLGGLQYVDIVDSTAVITNATSGESTLTVSEAIIDMEEPKMYIPSDALVEVQTTTRRSLADKTGTLKTLVIRVIDSQGVGTTADQNKLRNDIFEDDVSLKTQFEKCSYGKLKIQPFDGETTTGAKVNGGIVDVQVDYDVSAAKDRNSLALTQAAFTATHEQLGDIHSNEYNIVMFCMPPGTGDWLAYAYGNSKFSFYNNVWCSFVSAQLHEVGHNLGLGHSGEDGENNYHDKQGMMGFSYGRDDTNMCFNPAKSYQLGWYEDKVQTINPLDNSNNPVTQFALNGVSDYEKNNKALVVLRLEQTSFEQDYYIGYNRKDGINRDTMEDGNLVTIVRKEVGLPTEYGQSMKVAKLDLGQSHVIENFNGEENRDVEIKFIALLNDDATIQVIDVENAPKEEEEEPCATYTVELTTDRYPDENAWRISEDSGIGQVYANSPVYTKKITLHTTNVCLPYNKSYKFVITDQAKDGLCCVHGNGSYRVLDADGNELFAGGEKFETEEQAIQIGENPELLENTLCKDLKGKFLKMKKKKKKTRKKNCKWVAKKNRCDRNGVDANQWLWQSCPKACNRCADL